METEFTMLALSVLLGIANIILVSHMASWQRGYKWTAGSRDTAVEPLPGVAGRMERTLRNFLETFPFFVGVVFLAYVTNTHTWLTMWGAQLYFWGRIVYAGLYAADLPLARSLFWNVPTIGILLILAALFLK